MKTPKGKPGEARFDFELANAQFALFSFVFKMVGNYHSAQDVLQDVNLKLCGQREAYDAARPFLPWARTIARYEALSWRKRQARSKLIFSDEIISRLAETLINDDDSASERLEMLADCKKKLSDAMRDLLERHYSRNEKLSAISKALGRTEGSIANSLYYIRKALHRCIKEHLAQ